MIVPIIVSVAMGFFLFDRLRDDPGAVGLSLLDEYRRDIAAGTDAKQAKKKTEGDGMLTPRQKLFKFVLSSPYV